MKISLKIRDGKIEDARFKTFGCGSAIASSSMATELIKGRTLEEAKNFSNQEVVDALAVCPGQDSLLGSCRGSAEGRDRRLRDEDEDERAPGDQRLGQPRLCRSDFPRSQVDSGVPAWERTCR